MMSLFQLKLGVLLVQVTAAADSAFLDRVDPSMELCSVVEEALRSSYRADTADRLQVLENEMRASYFALPKTRFGHLDAPTTRYLLHRHFLRSRAWLVHGLAPAGVAGNASHSPIDLLDNSTIDKQTVKEQLQRRLLTRGLHLSEVAKMAAIIENQVHQDTVARLRKAWHAQELPNFGAITFSQAELVLDTYMMSYIIHTEKALEPKRVKIALKRVSNIYPNWSLTQDFVRTTLRRLRPNAYEQLTFADIEHIVVDLAENYGQFQFNECQELKTDLLSIEGPRPGRVPLKDFFDQALNHNKYQFGESVAYMRRVGILDESDPEAPSVVVPNYIDSPSQYVANSDNYAVTCIDECDRLMLQIEEQIRAPYASPARIAQIVWHITSETQPARSDEMPPKLTQRLQEIAIHEGGRRVALHGRLFAQWLHHAFPRECPYPHVSDANFESMLPEEFGQVFGKDSAYATTEEMEIYASKPAVANDSPDKELPWDATEELIVPADSSRSSLLPAAAVPWLQVVCCVALVVGLLPNVRLIKSGPSTFLSDKKAVHGMGTASVLDDKRMV